MIILDTDHLTVMKYRDSVRAIRLNARLTLAAISGEQIGTTIVNLEEQMRGWLSAIAKERLVHRQVVAYRELASLMDFFRGLYIFPLDAVAADHFEALNRLRIQSMDRKIASISLAQNALRFENWMDA